MKTSMSPIQGLKNITEEDWKECKGEKGRGHGGTLSCWHGTAIALLNSQQVTTGRDPQGPTRTDGLQAVNTVGRRTHKTLSSIEELLAANGC